MKLTRSALLILALWVALLAGLTWFVQRQLQVGADLRLFLPSPTTPEQQLLLEEIGEGPASRVLVIALEGAPPEELADTSRAFAESLQSNSHFRVVTNGETSLELLKVLQRWQPMQEPNRLFDVWFDREGRRALLLAQTQAAAFDPDQQRLALAELDKALKEVAGDSTI